MGPGDWAAVAGDILDAHVVPGQKVLKKNSSMVALYKKYTKTFTCENHAHALHARDVASAEQNT
jgi:hypothetical protein